MQEFVCAFGLIIFTIILYSLNPWNVEVSSSTQAHSLGLLPSVLCRVNGGILGNDPDLDNLIYDNLNYDQRHDFRNVYATMMSEWLGIDDQTISSVLTASNSETYSTNAKWTKLGLFKEGRGVEPAATGSPFGLMLMQNHPNPVITSTTIEFALPASTSLTLGIFNSAGQEVARLVDGLLNEGNHHVEFRPGGLASGRYFYRLVTPQDQLTRQMTVLH